MLPATGNQERLQMLVIIDQVNLRGDFTPGLCAYRTTKMVGQFDLECLQKLSIGLLSSSGTESMILACRVSPPAHDTVLSH